MNESRKAAPRVRRGEGGRRRVAWTVPAAAALGALATALVAVLAPASGAPSAQALAAAEAPSHGSSQPIGAGRPAATGAARAVSRTRIAPTRVEHLLHAINACPGKARACVDTGLRLSWIQRDGAIVYGPVRIMPGTPSLPGATATPHGTFHVRWKDADHVSGEFDEPMPNSVFFTRGGVAFHAGPLSSGSHGCVHLSRTASRFYYNHLRVGAEVAVFG
jgi:hypothetical protein